MWLLLFLFVGVFGSEKYEKVDPNGYIVYCPCMGRFGNQADHLLGSLSFAKSLDRTLVLPPWIEYIFPSSTQIPFDRYFDVDELKKYHRVILMHTFMKQIAPTLWPGDKRISFCHGPRGKSNDCAAKEGNPFGPFWNHFGISFMSSQFFHPQLTLDTVHNLNVKDNWNHVYPPKKFPVLAFVGAPASFPVIKQNVHLAKYMKWSTNINDKALKFIRDKLPEGKFIGIHLRRDTDWDNVCDIIKRSNAQSHLFASPQCLGYNNEFGKLNLPMCAPTWRQITDQVLHTVSITNAKSVFVSADKDAMIHDFNMVLKGHGIKAYTLSDSNVHVSLAILTKADHFIGNCISSFSAFVKRYRDNRDIPSSFWNFDNGKIVTSTAVDKNNKVEL